ncbi:sensor histidine kinase [Neobacillus sp. 114]|uniref:sensor histidine kinase n=1 Tax=Neobacillus sp. 114 TaxID=3048535 RepID=UPI0024C2D355|nr:sensor histidine kinase [Neobacillus sp. 114]
MYIKFFSKNELTLLAAMAILVPLAGEVKFYPFNEVYRVSFGPPALFLFLLGLRKVPAILCGTLAGVSVLAFRILLDAVFLEPFDWLVSIHANLPSFVYYFAYALVFFLLKIHQFNQRPWVIGLLGIVTEFAAGMSELFFERLLFEELTTIDAVHKIFIFAVFRSFFVVGLFSTLKYHESKLKETEIQKRNEHMIMVVSNLYEETILLKKTLQFAEKVTKQSYNLYKDLHEIKEGQRNFSLEGIPQQALRIAGEVHEIKKDNQRILSGLSKLITEESLLDYIDIDSLFSIIVRTNKKYAELLGKKIEFVFSISGTHPDYHAYTFTSIVNNLVSNSVEAINETGKIELLAEQNQDWLTIRVKDTGPGIPSQYKDVIFKPGFTLKFDSTGKSSTGIGLTYVKEVVEMHDGNVLLNNSEDGKGAAFTVHLPMAKITRKE